MNKCYPQNSPFISVKEVCNKIEIKDAFGLTRYVVIFIKCRNPNYQSAVIEDKNSNEYICQHNYWVAVCSCVPKNASIQEKIVYKRDYFSYTDAKNDFHEQVKRYSYLVKAETRYCQDISLFADSDGIKYEIINPECCYVCKYVRLAKKDRVFECHNPKLLEIYTGLINPDGDTSFGLSLHPKVSPSGKCLCFKRDDNIKGRPQRKLAEIIDNNVQRSVADAVGGIGTIIEKQVTDSVNETIVEKTEQTVEEFIDSVVFNCGDSSEIPGWMDFNNNNVTPTNNDSSN